MKFIKILSVFIFILAQIGCLASARQVRTERKPFQKSSFEIKPPTKYAHRQLENSKSYDPKPKVVLIDEKAGKYEFSWIGYDGKRKIAVYQRQDAIDAVVAASVEKISDGNLLYNYNLNIFPSSPNYFRNFIVQTFVPDSNPVPLENRKSYYIVVP